jgi:hypothetical protein
LFISIASSKVSNFKTYKIGTNNSSLRIGAFLLISTIVGYTKHPGLSLKTLPPTKIFPPYFTISANPSSYSFMAALVCKGPHNVL